MRNERIKQKNIKLEQANSLIQQIDISKYEKEEYILEINGTPQKKTAFGNRSHILLCHFFI